MSTWQNVRLYLQRLSGFAAFATNSLLITLIVHKSPKAFGAYRYLMIYMSVFEMGYAFIDLLLRPEVIAKGTYWYCVMDSNQSFFPFDVQYVLLVTWAGAFGVSMANFGVHFLYRYLVVTGRTEWTSSTGIRMWLWMSTSVIYGIAWGVLSHYFEKRNAQGDIVMRSLESMKAVPIEEIVYFGFNFYIPSESGKRVMNWFSVTGLLLLTTLIGISFVMMTFFGTKCYLAIKKLSDVQPKKSQRSRTIQSQLFYSLVLQTAIPMVLMHIPCSLVFLTALFDKTQEFYGYLLTTSIAMFPAIDPLPSIIVIEPFRRAVKEAVVSMFHWKRGKRYEGRNISMATIRTTPSS